MNRNEALTYLKELLTQCNGMSPNAVSLEPKSSDPSYSIHIKGSINEADKQIVIQIAKNHNLAVKESADGVVVYKPK